MGKCGSGGTWCLSFSSYRYNSNPGQGTLRQCRSRWWTARGPMVLETVAMVSSGTSWSVLVFEVEHAERDRDALVERVQLG